MVEPIVLVILKNIFYINHLGEWGREDCDPISNPCQADIDGDGLVYPSDAMIMLEQ
jgi:hypothetical protein